MIRNDFPLISVITVTYNAEESIESTLKCIQSLNYSNLEYIIIDGNSSDNTLKIVKRYKQWVNVIISEPDTGIYDAMNKGINIAKGTAIMLLNAGDTIHKDLLLEVLKFELPLEDHVFASDWVVVDKNLDVKAKYFAHFQFNKKMGASHTGVLVGKNIYTKFGLYNTNYKFVADHDFFLKIWKVSPNSFIRIPYNWTYYFFEGATTNNIKKALNERLTIISRHFKFHEAIEIKIRTYARILLFKISGK